MKAAGKKLVETSVSVKENRRWRFSWRTTSQSVPHREPRTPATSQHITNHGAR